MEEKFLRIVTRPAAAQQMPLKITVCSDSPSLQVAAVYAGPVPFSHKTLPVKPLMVKDERQASTLVVHLVLLLVVQVYAAVSHEIKKRKKD